MLENKVRSFATDLVRSLSSCFGQLPNSLAVNQNNCLPASTSQVAMALKLMSQLSNPSQLLCTVKMKLAVQFSRQLLRRTTVNHLVFIKIINTPSSS